MHFPVPVRCSRFSDWRVAQRRPIRFCVFHVKLILCGYVFKKRRLDNATASVKPTVCYKGPIFWKTPENQDPAKDVGRQPRNAYAENLLAFNGRWSCNPHSICASLKGQVFCNSIYPGFQQVSDSAGAKWRVLLRSYLNKRNFTLRILHL